MRNKLANQLGARIWYGLFVSLACFLISCSIAEKQETEHITMPASVMIGLQRKANGGDLDSMKKLIIISYNELHDQQLWRKWTLLAADRGDPDAQSSMFSFLIEDDSECSLLRSRFWLEKAKGRCKLPIMDSKLKVMSEKITASGIDGKSLLSSLDASIAPPAGTAPKEVHCVIEKKALDGDPDAALRCAQHWFAKKEYSNGLYWLEIASENGSQKAKESMLAIRKELD